MHTRMFKYTLQSALYIDSFFVRQLSAIQFAFLSAYIPKINLEQTKKHSLEETITVSRLLIF